jgi:hypothetical protein
MIAKSINKIVLDDLTALIGRVRESKTLEFKKMTPEGKDAEIKFLAGVSALANTAGGDFVIGVTATKDGLAEAVSGVTTANLDAEKLRLEQLLATCLEPRLPRVDIHTVACGGDRHVLVIRVPHSWIGPHRVTKDNKFYGRNSAGKYPLDVSELRTAFGLADSAAERIRAFRTDRLAKIIAGESPVPIAGRGAVVLHMVPLPSFADRQLFDVVGAVASGSHFPLPLDGMGGGNQVAVNLDGVLNYVMHSGADKTSYGQLFRSGAIEGFSPMSRDAEGNPYIVGAPFANMIVAAARQYLAVLASLEVAFPVYAMLSLCGIGGCSMKYDMGGGWQLAGPLHGTLIAVPEVAIESAQADVPALLQPIFNIVWNAFGFARCDMYSNAGGWKGTT